MLQTFQDYTQYKKERQSVQRQPICIDDADHGYIIDETERRDHIEYEVQIHNGET